MAYSDRIVRFSTNLGSESIAAATQGTARSAGARKMVYVAVDAPVYVKLGTDTTITAAATDRYLPSGAYVFQMPNGQAGIRLFNNGAAAVNTTIALLSSS